MLPLRLLILTLLLSNSASPVRTQTSNPIEAPPPTGTLVEVGGYRVHLYCTGAGSPTVVIVGAGPSFSWGLVQPEVSQTTRVCSYDHSGTTWSDDGPSDSCSLRVDEVHTALRKLGVTGPFVLVGHSVGGLVARLYAERFPTEAAGIVFVDHAFTIINRPLAGTPWNPAAISKPDLSNMQPLGIESDPNFDRLPIHDRELQFWVMAQSRYRFALKTSASIAPECSADLQKLEVGRDAPLGDKPVVDVDRAMGVNLDYQVLQSQLLSLSRNSKELTAKDSSHFVLIDRPDLVVQAILEAIHSVRTRQKLGSGTDRIPSGSRLP